MFLLNLSSLEEKKVDPRASLISHCENIEYEKYILLWCHVMYCMQCLGYERNMLKTLENVINRKLNDMDDRRGIYVTREAGFF